MNAFRFPLFHVGLFATYAIDYGYHEVEDVDYVDITDIQEEDPGEEAYCVPI